MARRASNYSRTHHKIHFYDPIMDGSAARRHLIHDRLEMALLNNQITLNFQPIWLADGTRVIKFEALARWHDEELGIVSPGEFVPIAEKNARLSHLLTYYVLRMACMEARTWLMGSGHERPDIAVNIPAREFYQPEFADAVLDLLSEVGLEPSRLTLELTEEGLVQDIDQTIRTMERLSEKGVMLALDDFGTGYSSLSHFNRLPVNVLKIDKSFIDALPGHNKSLQLVAGIIKIAHAMGLIVVAEGVEHEAQRALLVELDCDMIQGYLLGRPIAAVQVHELLKSTTSQGD
jgi:EAL domain-containing protein (putative c-di-GMP-specific phosphodiesterase class I)